MGQRLHLSYSDRPDLDACERDRAPGPTFPLTSPSYCDQGVGLVRGQCERTRSAPRPRYSSKSAVQLRTQVMDVERDSSTRALTRNRSPSAVTSKGFRCTKVGSEASEKSRCGIPASRVSPLPLCRRPSGHWRATKRKIRSSWISMDQHLLGDAVAVERGCEELAAIPTLSLVMDMADLFGPAKALFR